MAFSSQKKIIVVIGATGNQGSSVAHTFLSLPNWHVRCLTRNPSSAAAQKLSSLGAEIIQGDLSDPASLMRAFDSAHAIFANTDFWATYRDPNTPARAAAANSTASQFAFDLEVRHGTNISNAAADIPTLERFVYSALPPMTKASQGKYTHSYHWDSKAATVEYIETKQPALAKKMSLIYLGGYATNSLLHPRWEARAGKFMIVAPIRPEARLPIIDTLESTGVFVRALVEDEEPGTKLLAYGSDSNLMLQEIAKLWGRVLGKEVVYQEVSVEVIQKMIGLPLEVLDGPAFISEFGYMHGVEGAIEPGQLKHEVKTRSFEEWLRSRDWTELLEQAKVEKSAEGN